MASKKKFYAVAVGQDPGIYTNWPQAQAQVKGYPGAKFKGFPTKSEAEAWMQHPALEPCVVKKSSITKPADSSPHRKGEVTIYTDGGSINNPGPGGYGIVIVHDDDIKEISGGFSHTTNNRMELMGCIVALRDIGRIKKKITLYSDSSYVVNGIMKGWAKGWRKKGWIKSDKKPAINPDLWAELLDLVEGLDITLQWVKGHAGNPLNERCDKLAVAAARQQNSPADKGHKR